MFRPCLPSILIGPVLAICLPSAAAAAEPATQSKAGAQILRPLTVQKTADLEFGWITVTGAGTIVINPVDETATTSGGVLRAGGVAHPARFTGAASDNAVVLIKLPKQPVTLTRLSGTETMTLSNLTLDGPDRRSMAQSNSFDFRVGGTLNVGANQAEGDYEGTFTVTVQYP